MKTRWHRSVLQALLIVAACLIGSPAFADNHNKSGDKAAEAPPGTLSDMWMLWPKDGQSMELESGIKAFMAWRKANGDPFTWSVWTQAVGSDLDVYAIRSSQHHWKDLDAIREWSRAHGVAAKYRELVGPYVSRLVRHLDEVDRDLSRWNFEGTPNYVGLSTVKVLPGKWPDVKSALETFKKSADEQQWSESWSVMRRIGGSGGVMFAWPYKNYDDMEDPEVNGMALLEKALGSREKAGEVMSRYRSSVESVDYTIWARRPDLTD